MISRRKILSVFTKHNLLVVKFSALVAPEISGVAKEQSENSIVSPL
jgi:hypothetical protein